MRLVIREYLSMLRESGELDALMPDLLFVMGIEPISKAQVGVRQFGVDVAGVGADPDDDGNEKLFLLTVRQGNIDRGDWEGSPQAVRPSLDEILDVYIPHHVAEEHRDLPKKIIVCCGGDLKQAAEPNWRGYKDRNAEPGPQRRAGSERIRLLGRRQARRADRAALPRRVPLSRVSSKADAQDHRARRPERG